MDILLVIGNQMLVVWSKVVQSKLQHLAIRMELALEATDETI